MMLSLLSFVIASAISFANTESSRTYFMKAVLNHLPAIMIFLGATPSRSHIVANDKSRMKVSNTISNAVSNVAFTFDRFKTNTRECISHNESNTQ